MTTVRHSTCSFDRIISVLLMGVAGSFGASRMVFAADASERWVATGGTAMSVTGNVRFDPGRITFQGGTSLQLDVVADASGFRPSQDAVDAEIYRVRVPADPLLRNKNRICGSRKQGVPITYIVVWQPLRLPGDQAMRNMAAFSGRSVPRTDTEITSCGVFNYELGE